MFTQMMQEHYAPMKDVWMQAEEIHILNKIKSLEVN